MRDEHPDEKVSEQGGTMVDVLFTEVVQASAAVTAARARRDKIAALAEVLVKTEPADLPIVTAMLSGAPRQGKVNVAWNIIGRAEPRYATEPELTVSDVDSVFAMLVEVSGKGSGQVRWKAVQGLFARATTDERAFLVKLIMQDLRQGALELVMVEAIAAAAKIPSEQVRRAFMLSGGLADTASAALYGGAEAVAAIRLQLGRPVRPMLASPAKSLEAAREKLGDTILEYKMDGARIQVHRDGDEVHVFTRSLREITESVPEIAEVVRSLPCESIVLDGETLALSGDNKPRPFVVTMSRFGARSPQEMLLHPYFFDLLHLDGEDLLDEPLWKRRTTLERVVGKYVMPIAGTIEEPVRKGHEGVVIKDLDSLYNAGRRGNWWQKLKPVHTLDLVVTAVERGHGRRWGRLSNIHLAARDSRTGELVMVGKTFKGMTDEMLKWQTEKFIELHTEDDGHTVALRPELVVEIAVDGAQLSTRYPGGVSLRFARVVRYREDKTAAEADTLDTIRELLIR